MENDLDNLPVEPATDQASPDEGKKKAVSVFLDIIETLVFSLLLFALINTLTARIRVDGMSMEPTLHSGEFVLVNRLAYRFGEPRYGDVIVFRFPRNPEQEYIKRIIGLPGDQVVIADRQVLVNGEVLEEPYIAALPRYENTWVIPEGSLFVLGDNRNNSSDSHNWGPVPIENVVGKAIFVYWPPADWGLVAHASQ
jgi:signal peptidase I